MTEPADARADTDADPGAVDRGAVDPGAVDPGAGAPGSPAPGSRFADLPHRPVAEHVAVFEDEHDRLQRELGTIDQL